ncbi:MAG: DNRLRE domain-containing protein, partial [Peptococcaceae bacterium]|nr:DNRLRE domain-containing protein [Peptococcaceae bacterium]
MYIGYESNAYNICRGYLRFDFPGIPQGSRVVAANLLMYQHSYSCAPGNSTATPFTLHAVSNTTWSSNTLTWNNKPAYTSTVSDYAITSSANNGKDLQFDVTKLVKDVYESPATTKRLSVMLKSTNETTTVPYANVRLYSANYPGLPQNAKPFIYFHYRDTRGLEDHLSYTTMSAGVAGTAHINDYTGNLVFEHVDAMTSGLRLPVTLSSSYNSCIAKTLRPGGPTGEIRTGRGWKLNLVQQVQTAAAVGFQGDTAVYPYVYTDGDGTHHYFYKDGSAYYDEDGLGLELKKPATGYTIQDKKDNTMTFNASGYLTEIRDANGNTATISYLPGTDRITAVTDGVGHTLTLTAPLNTNNNAYLKTLEDPSGRQTTYTYDNDGYLIKIKYPDNTATTYEYNANGQLTKAISPNGIGLDIHYKSDASVSWAREYGGTAANPMSHRGLTYRFDRSKYNTTIIEGPGQDGMLIISDSDPRNDDNTFTTLQFDDWGRPTSTITKTGSTTLGASATTYTRGSEATNTDIKKRNRVAITGTLARNAVNLSINGGAETALGAEWTAALWGSGPTSTFTFDRTTADKYQGNYALRLISTHMEPNDGARAYQSFTTQDIKANTAYTFSAYVKTGSVTLTTPTPDSGVALILEALAPGGTVTDASEWLTGTTDTAIDNGWRRIYATLTTPADVTTLRTNLIIRGATGTAYFDNMQLEASSVLNACNLLENPSLERGSGINPTSWNPANLSTAAGDGLTTAHWHNGANSFKITGEPTKNKELKQDIIISGTSRDTYIISGWAWADAVKRDDTRFDILATVTYTSGATKDRRRAAFNPCITGWQYTSGVFTLGTGNTTADLPVKITVRLRWNKQANPAYFDNIQLIKDNAPSYTYDDNGNLISVSANAANKSTMEYANNNLTQYTDAKGYSYSYVYDAKHNLTKATSQKGVTQNYTYDIRGNATTLEIKSPGNTMSILTEAVYTQGMGAHDEHAGSAGISPGGYIKETQDQNGHTERYLYEQKKGLLLSHENQKGVTTAYTYDATTDRLTNVAAGGASVSYAYQNDRLSQITHNNTQYTFAYTPHGNVDEIKVGTQRLIKNTYNDWGSSLKTAAYGNNDLIEYTYNSRGQISSIKKGTTAVAPTTKYSWSYDNTGTPWRHRDSVSGLTHQYRYDSIGRLIQQRVFTTNTAATEHETQFGYDKNNNLNKLVNNAPEGLKTTTSYVYAQDNLPTSTTLASTSSRKQDYTYDNLNRLTDIDTTTDAPVNTHYKYKLSDRNAPNQSQYRTTLVSTEFIGLRAYSYTFDVLGNITKITEGTRANQQETTGSGYVTKVTYEYDALNQLTRENNVYTNTTTVYTYDQGGNITTKKEYPYTTGTPGTATSTVTYAYGDMNWRDKL